MSTTSTSLSETENGAISHSSTMEPCLNLFFHSVRGMNPDRFQIMFNDAWQVNPTLTIQLLAYIRDCRGGKGERQLGRMGLQLLAERLTPDQWRNVLCHFLGTFGRWDDAIDITAQSDVILSVIAQQLNQDLVLDHDTGHISLCAKWIPSEHSNPTFFHALARHMKMTPKNLRKNVLVPLRNRLELVETNLTHRQYDRIVFNNVPSNCMAIHGLQQLKYKSTAGPGAFVRHCSTRFSKWKQDQVIGNRAAKINASQLFIHDLVKCYTSVRPLKQVDDLIELQWQCHLKEAQTVPSLKRTLVLSDVSGSMAGTPMLVSMAFGLLISNIADEPWRNLVMTFEEEPELHLITGSSLFEQCISIRNMRWGGSTNLQRCFDLILNIIRQHHLSPDQIPERLLIISDMQFNQCDDNFQTNLEAARVKFASLDIAMPQVVFWNVRGNISDFPAVKDTPNVSLISGFSTDILKSLMETGTAVTPESTMLNTLQNPRYACFNHILDL